MIMDFKKELVDVWIKRSIGIVVFVAVLVVFLCWFQHDPEMAKFAAYLVGGGLLVWQVRASSQRAKAAEDTATAMQKTANLTEKGNIAERFKNAIEHLGHASPSIRLGGIYALHHIAQDVEEYRERIFEILCAYIRETTTQEGYKPKNIPIGGKNSEVLFQPSIEIQSILKLLFRKLLWNKPYDGFYANLEHANLAGSMLREANLQNAILFFINLEDAILDHANLQGAFLNFSNLQGARLYNTNLQGARLYNTNLEGAQLNNSNLEGANLSGTKNVTVEQLLKSETLYKAILPDGMEAEIRQRKPELLEKPKPDDAAPC